MKFLQFAATIVALPLFFVDHVSGKQRFLRPTSGQKEPCILVNLEVQFMDGSSQSNWQCELSPTDANDAGQFFVDVEGLTHEELKGTRSGVTSLFAEGATFANGKLMIPPGAKKSIGRVDKRGPAAQKNKEKKDNTMKLSNDKRRLAAGIVEKRLVLAVRVVATDSSPNSTLAQIRNFIFGTSGDVVNLKERFQSCSYGELLMDPYNGTTVKGRIVTTGAYQVSVAASARGVEERTLVNAAISQLNAQLGDLPSQFDHVMFCIPPGTVRSGSTSWGAYANLNSWMSVYNNQWCNYADAQVHEIGHNLNLYHSSEGTEEYGDRTCMMGNGGTLDTVRMCYNAAKSAQLDWYSRRSTTLDFSRRGGFNGQLIGVNSYQHPSSAGKYVYVKVLGRPYSQPDVFVGFNLAAGINANTFEAINQVTVYTMQSSAAKSFLVGKLSQGGLFTLPNFAGTTALNVRVKSINLTAVPPIADVDIFMTGCAPGVCGPACNSCCVATDCAPADPCASVTCQATSCIYNTTRCAGLFRFEMTSDGYPEETSWDVLDQCSGQVVISGDSYSSRSATPTPISLRSSGVIGHSSYTFTMRDSYGDGMFDGNVTGNFKATFDGVLVSQRSGDFGSQVSSEFGRRC